MAGWPKSECFSQSQLFPSKLLQLADRPLARVSCFEGIIGTKIRAGAHFMVSLP